MTKVLGMIMSVAMLVALAGCAATDQGSTQKQASEKPAAAKVSAEGEKAGCQKAKQGCCAKAEGACPHAKAGCSKATETK